jgi:hypothetical protein
MRKKKQPPGHAEGESRDPRCEPLSRDLPLVDAVREKLGGLIDAVYDDLDDVGRKTVAEHLREHASFLEGVRRDAAT